MQKDEVNINELGPDEFLRYIQRGKIELENEFEFNEFIHFKCIICGTIKEKNPKAVGKRQQRYCGNDCRQIGHKIGEKLDVNKPDYEKRFNVFDSLPKDIKDKIWGE